ncbi:acyl-CoA dehydrogenase family protein [uncultured Pseudoramibacter sp.]|uniref:acyl-CoA dehydrogenase family protein n=1 Tax=uncultured Pseudoramibacter sp. TaxID=1623493 RepID=UPI0025E7F9DF|nr:acyl-CoA dehydrogenase family protein [uncultured Pseudoramibacter sp.]
MLVRLTEEQEEIRTLVAEFAGKVLAPSAADRDEVEAIDTELIQEMAEIGLMSIGIPEEYGGLGFGSTEKAIVVEEIAKKDAAVAELVSVHNMAYTAILKHGSDALKEHYLPIAAEGGVAAFALTEPQAGSDSSAVRTTAVADGDDYIINGSKCFISNFGPHEGAFVTLLALTEPEKGTKGLTAFVVDRDNPGMKLGRREEKMGIRAADVSEIFLEDCRVSKDKIVGEPGKGFNYFMEALDAGRIGMAAQAIGLAEEAIDLSADYMKTRVQFGKPIAKLQGLQWYLADMATKTAAAKALVYQAAASLDRGERATTEAAMAKYFASETAVAVVDKALQIHGGYGYMRDYPLERMYRDVRIIPIYEGTSEIQKLIISRALLK